MYRMLLALILAGALAAGASGSTVQFSINGVPVDGSVPIEVVASDVIMVGVWIVPDAPIENFWVDIFATGPWDPFAQSGCVIQPIAPWDNEDFVWLPPEFPNPWPGSIGGFLRGDPWAGPGAVAEFPVHLPDLPMFTILNLEYDYAEVGAGGADMLPLVLHSPVPEPMSLSLLVLGGLVALRRRLT